MAHISEIVDILSEAEWIERALNSFTSVEPKEKGIDYIRARENWARKLVSNIPAERIPRLIVALFDNYETATGSLFMEMMWLVESLYASLPTRVSHEDACAILAATRHSCGHGGVVEPLKLAKASFGGSSYTPEFFEALRTYRERLAGISSFAVTEVRGEIAAILWQDPNEPLRPRNCLSGGLRRGYFALESDHKNQWSKLLAQVDRSARRRPDKGWILGARLALNNFGSETFAEDLAEWLQFSDGQVSLSTGGRHVVKTMIWFTAVSRSNRLDELLPRLIDVDYTKPEAAVHLIYAVGYWLESKPREFADEHRKRLRQKWPIAGSRIRD